VVGGRNDSRLTMRAPMPRQPNIALRAQPRLAASRRHRRAAHDAFARLRRHQRPQVPRRHLQKRSAPTTLRWSEGKVASPSPLFLAGSNRAITISLRLKIVANPIPAPCMTMHPPNDQSAVGAEYAGKKFKIRYYVGGVWPTRYNG